MDDDINKNMKRSFWRLGNVLVLFYTILVLGTAIFSGIIYEKYYEGKGNDSNVSEIRTLIKTQTIYGLVNTIFCILFLGFYIFIGERKYTKYEKSLDSFLYLTTTSKYLLSGVVILGFGYCILLAVNAGKVSKNDEAIKVYRSDITNSFMTFILGFFLIILTVFIFKSKELYSEEISKGLSSLQVDELRKKLEQDIDNKLKEWKGKNTKIQNRINNNQKLLKETSDTDVISRRTAEITRLQDLIKTNEACITKLEKNKTGYMKKFDKLEKTINDKKQISSTKKIIEMINTEWDNTDVFGDDDNK